MSEAKESIRQRILSERQSRDPAWYASHSVAICERIAALECFQRASRIGMYMAMRGEVVTDGLMGELIQKGVRIGVPNYVEEDAAYVFVEVSSETEFASGHFGCREAVDAEPMNGVFDLILVPGIAFDPHGNRIGHGRGYYDRLLTGAPARGATMLGVAFEFQIVPEINPAPHDVPVEMIVTEERLITRGQG